MRFFYTASPTRLNPLSLMLIPLNNEGLERIHELYCSDSGLNKKDVSYIIQHWNRKLGESFEFNHDLFSGWKKFHSSYEALCSLYPFRYVSNIMKEAADTFGEDRVMSFPAKGSDDDLSSLFLRRIRQDYDVISYREKSNEDLNSGRVSWSSICGVPLETVICKKKKPSK